MKNHPPIPTKRSIKKFLKQLLFGKNIFCPRCHSYEVVAYHDRYRCRTCLCRFSLLSHTFLAGTKLSLQSMWQIVWCFVNEIPVKQAQSLTGLSEKAVRHWYALLRTQLTQLDTKLSGTIQVDEVYLGGWSGRAIIAGKAVKTKEVRFHICNRHEVYGTDVVVFFTKYITPGSTICTDASPLYPRTCRLFSCAHYRDIHKKFEFTLTSEIEGLFGTMRTFIRRMYHHITVKKLPEYLVEFQYRFSRKEYFSSVEQFLLNTLSLVTTG